MKTVFGIEVVCRNCKYYNSGKSICESPVETGRTVEDALTNSCEFWSFNFSDMMHEIPTEKSVVPLGKIGGVITLGAALVTGHTIGALLKMSPVGTFARFVSGCFLGGAVGYISGKLVDELWRDKKLDCTVYEGPDREVMAALYQVDHEVLKKIKKHFKTKEEASEDKEEDGFELNPELSPA